MKANVSGLAETAMDTEDSKCNLIINFLPLNMTQEDIKSLFSCMGELESCKLIRDKTTAVSLGYAFVKYAREEDAERAKNTFDGLKLNNKIIRVSYARPSSASIKGSNVYVSGLPRSMKQEDFECLFSPYGRIINSVLLTNYMKDDAVKGVGLIRLEKKEEAERAIKELNGTVLPGSTDPIMVRFAKQPANKQTTPTPQFPQEARLGKSVAPIKTNRMQRYSPLGMPIPDIIIPNLAQGVATLYVTNLPATSVESDEALLYRLFAPFGAIQSVKVIEDLETKKSKGFGFVNMINYDDALSAIQLLNGRPHEDKVLKVSFKTNKKPKAKN